jgi:hypothetical protein
MQVFKALHSERCFETTIGIFSTEELAIAACIADATARRPGYGERWSVEPITLDTVDFGGPEFWFGRYGDSWGPHAHTFDHWRVGPDGRSQDGQSIEVEFPESDD